MLQLTFNPGLTLTGFRTTRHWVERGTVRVVFAQEHNIMFLAWVQTSALDVKLSVQTTRPLHPHALVCTNM